MGAKLFQNFGFKETELVLIKGYKQHPEPIDISFAIREVGEEKTERL